MDAFATGSAGLRPVRKRSHKIGEFIYRLTIEKPKSKQSKTSIQFIEICTTIQQKRKLTFKKYSSTYVNWETVDETGLLLDSGMEPILRARHIQVANAARATLGIASRVSLFM